jgi:hypothetical protein
MLCNCRKSLTFVYIREEETLEKYIEFKRKNKREGVFAKSADIGDKHSFMHRGSLLCHLGVVQY